MHDQKPAECKSFYIFWANTIYIFYLKLVDFLVMPSINPKLSVTLGGCLLMPPHCLELGLIDVAGQGTRCTVFCLYEYVGTYEYLHRALVTAWYI
jgi:hypothetical protein